MRCLVLRRTVLSLWISTALGLVGAISLKAAEPATGAPATLAEAIQTLDVSKLPLVKGAEKPGERNEIQLSYQAPGKVKDVFEFHRKQLLDQQWTEATGTYVSDETCSATLLRNGFVVSLAAFGGSKPDTVSVMLNNHGNVALDRLPKPEGVTTLYAGPATVNYTTETPAEQTTAAVRKLLLDQGWQPYGSAGDVTYFKQNNVQVSAFIMHAPALGKTSIGYSATMLLVDLPAPAETENLQYTDSPTQLSFDTAMAGPEVFDFYRQALAKKAWQATTSAPIKTGFKGSVIFRNPQKEMLTLEMSDIEGKTRVMLRWMSAAQFAEMERRARAKGQGSGSRRPSNTPSRPKLTISLPTDASEARTTKSQIEFKLPSGKAKSVLTAWRDQFVRDGWKEQTAVLEDVAGSIVLEKGTQTLTVTYTDTGFLPTEVDVMAIGADLQVSDEK